MADKSKIEWTQATWNPVTGCNKVSPGCKNCYAEREWKRLSANPGSVYYGRSFTDVQCHPERLKQPLQWQKPRMIFVNSMSDLFHKDVPFEFIDKVLAVAALAERHTFQILTKRADRMFEYFETYFTRHKVAAAAKEFSGKRGRYGCDEAICNKTFPLPNVWLGVSVENQEQASNRIPFLLKTPAAVRWISAEPLLGWLDLSLFLNAWHATLSSEINRIDWVVTGGESGASVRPSHISWFRFLRDQCVAAKVPFFFKQWGQFKPVFSRPYIFVSPEGKIIEDSNDPDDCMRPVKKKKDAGRELDGRTWDEMPEVRR